MNPQRQAGLPNDRRARGGCSMRPRRKERGHRCAERPPTSRAKRGLLRRHREAALAPVPFLWRLLTARGAALPLALPPAPIPADRSKVCQPKHPPRYPLATFAKQWGENAFRSRAWPVWSVATRRRAVHMQAREEDPHHIPPSHKRTLRHRLAILVRNQK